MEARQNQLPVIQPATEKYEFKSLLRQKYFNERFKEKALPTEILNKEC